jgi:hypothetical protein
MKAFVVLIPVLAGTALCATEGAAPDWVTQAASLKPPAYAPKVTSVVLLQEESVSVDADGRRVMRERGAVRVLQPGERLAATRAYDTKTGRIRDFQGWLISPAGKVTPYAKTSIVDAAASANDTYDEYRLKVLECGAAPPGSVFAWEVTEEEKTVFTQYEYAFQAEMPVLTSRFSLSLPAGWEVKGTVLNGGGAEPQVAGGTYTWQLSNLPWIEREEHSPSLAALAPRLAVSYFPPVDNKAGLQGLGDWSAVSAWLSPLVDPAAGATDTVRAKSLALIGGASGELEKIRAIAAFTQKTNYVEIALNLTHGGGYTPHRAEETLARNYGDCKDKATLMRALLKAAGIDSYLIVITADDRTYVRPEWPSPHQFNHAIIAVRVSDQVELPTVMERTPLGRLLIFDPTDPFTQVGDLPEDEQGSHALVIAGAQGALLTMPLLPASANRIESSVEGSIGITGHLDAKVARQYFGQASISLRAVEITRGSDELKKRFERGFGRRIAGTTVGKVTTDAQVAENRLGVNVDVAAEHFGQNMQGKLFVVRPGLLTSGGDYLFTSKQRTAPVKLDADLRRDVITIKVPEGFKADELPDQVKIESPYGSLDAKWSVRDGAVVMEQSLEIKECLVPAREYAKVLDFFDRVGGAQQAAVILAKQ